MTGFNTKVQNVMIHLIKNSSRETLEKFRLYTLEIESNFQTQINQLHERFEDEKKELDDYKQAELSELYGDECYQLEDMHIGIYRKATVVSVYSFLENALNRICRHLCSRNKYPIGVEDLKGDGIVRAKIYLEKFAEIDFSIINGEWSILMDLNKIRNCIVHCEGDITHFKQKIKIENIVENNSSLKLMFSNKLIVNREYLDYIISNIENFLDKVYEQALHK